MADTSYLESRIAALEEQLAATTAEVEELRAAQRAAGVDDVEGEVLEDEPEEEGGLELEALEYRGVTYYKDSDDNVYGTDEEGAVIPEPIARWNGTKLVRLS